MQRSFDQSIVKTVEDISSWKECRIEIELSAPDTYVNSKSPANA
jgi:hypothetical protein